MTSYRHLTLVTSVHFHEFVIDSLTYILVGELDKPYIVI